MEAQEFEDGLAGKSELAVRDNEFRLRVIAFKLYTISSKSLTQSGVYLCKKQITHKGEVWWEKLSLNALHRRCAQKHCGTPAAARARPLKPTKRASGAKSSSGMVSILTGLDS